MKQDKKVKAKNHESYTNYTVISLIIPIVGIIMGAIYLTKETPLDKKFGEHLVVTAIMGGILASLIFFVL